MLAHFQPLEHLIPQKRDNHSAIRETCHFCGNEVVLSSSVEPDSEPYPHPAEFSLHPTTLFH
jgi:hypothetical protein